MVSTSGRARSERVVGVLGVMDETEGLLGSEVVVLGLAVEIQADGGAGIDLIDASFSFSSYPIGSIKLSLLNLGSSSSFVFVLPLLDISTHSATLASFLFCFSVSTTPISRLNAASGPPSSSSSLSNHSRLKLPMFE
jgi:hypothetical protein